MEPRPVFDAAHRGSALFSCEILGAYAFKSVHRVHIRFLSGIVHVQRQRLQSGTLGLIHEGW